MDLIVNERFSNLSIEEMELIDGGSKKAAQVIMITGGAVIAGVLAPITCGGSIGAYVASAAAGYTLMAGGILM